MKVVKFILVFIFTFSLLEARVINRAGEFNLFVGSLADQLSQNKDIYNYRNTPIALTSFVELNDFRKCDTISNLLTDSLIHEMQIRGFRVIDYKTMPNIVIKEDGDYSFSRDVKELKKRHDISAVLSGTYIKTRDGVIFNARIVEIKSNIVLSSGQIFIPDCVINYLDYQKPVKSSENFLKISN
jgi:TolB-like protein